MSQQPSNRNTERSSKAKWGLYHIYYKRTGFYRFLSKNLIKLTAIIIAFLGIYFVVDAAYDVDQFFTNVMDSFPYAAILGVFLLSETILGLVPPDLFIIWAGKQEYAWGLLTVLATLSYTGGVFAYWLGVGLRKLPKVNAYVTQKYVKEMTMLSRWGGFFIIIAALLPLPFAVISTLVGVIQYDFRHFLMFGLFRFLRFFIYAIVLFQL